MSEPPGVPSALGIEAVEWFPRDDESLTVRVTGRWRRRRPALSGQPLLVIEVGGQRHRLPAMPEPPGLTGAAPGTWQLSFTVPSALMPSALERAWLQMGAVVVPVPIAVQGQSAPDIEGDAAPEGRGERHDEVTDPQLLAERRLRSSELALQATRLRASHAEQRVADLAARVEELERELQAVRVEPARLQALLRQRDAARRAAEQRAHAERAMRTELQEELAQLEGEGDDTEAVIEELELARERVAELESELDQMSRQADEAEQIAAAARVARDRAQAALEDWAAAQRESTLRIPDLAVRVAAEERLWDGLAQAAAPLVLPKPRRLPAPNTLSAERRLIQARGRASTSPDSATLVALRQELATRAASEANLRSRLALTSEQPAHAGAATPGSPKSMPDSVLSETLVALRVELLALRSLAETERERRHGAESRVHELEWQVGDYEARCAGAYAAIEQLRAELERIRIPAGRPPELAAGVPIARPDDALAQPVAQARRPDAEPRRSLDPERLDAALARLRESAAAQEATVAGTQSRRSGPWLSAAFALLTERDPVAAGRLLLALLPAQGLVAPEPLAYDLMLGGLGCVHVTAAGGGQGTTVRLSETPRPAGEVRFALTGELGSLAALVATGSLRRRFGRRRVRITGQRAAAGALLELVRMPLGLGELIASGVSMDPWLALTTASLMVDPAWTRGERFSLAFQEPEGTIPVAHLHVRDGRRPAVSTAALSQAPVATVVCAGERVLPVLDGNLRAGARLHGDTRPLALLQHWIERAQSG